MKRKGAVIAYQTNKNLSNRLKLSFPFYIMFVPVLVWYLLFCYAPMSGVIISFKEYTFRQGIWGSPWVGLKNFEEFIKNGDFWKVFKNTIVISFWRIVIGFPLPIIFALLLNEVPHPRFKRGIQTISYLPHFVSWVVISGLLFTFFSSEGLVNKVIVNSGNAVIPFMSSTHYFVGFLVLSALWKEIGWNAIIYLAALSSIDTEMYESAMIDGANRRQQLLYITFPAIRGVISIMFILSLTTVLSVGFEQVLVLINSSVQSVAETIDYYIYRVGLQQANNYSYATAVGLFKSALSLFLVLGANYMARKIDSEGGLW